MTTATMVWEDVCALADLPFDRGVCALVAGVAVALFRVAPTGALYAISNHDPFSGASVMSRGLIGSSGDVVKVASPMYKQSFNLETGVCLDDPTVCIATFAIRVIDERVQVGLAQ